MFTACARLRPVAAAPDDVLPKLRAWLELPVAFDPADSASLALRQDSEARSLRPRSRAAIEGAFEACIGEGSHFLNVTPQGAAEIKAVRVVAIQQPRKLPDAVKRKVYQLTLPYTARAFHQDLRTMSEKTLQEHIDHATPGDVLLLAVATTNTVMPSPPHAGQQSPAETPQLTDIPWVVGHQLVDILKVTIPPEAGSTEGERTSPSRLGSAMCILGICCDPLFQKIGVSTLIQDYALALLKPDCVVLRTVNPSVIKMLRRTSPDGSAMYPNDCGSESEWDRARAVANQVVKQWEHVQHHVHLFDATALVVRGVYSAHDQKVFNKSSNCSKGNGGGGGRGGGGEGDRAVAVQANVSDIPILAGDAVLRVVVLPSSRAD